jgi:hypothetical protein
MSALPAFRLGYPTVSPRLRLTDDVPVKSFTVSYRPRHLGEVFGQDAVVADLRRFVAAPYSTAFLFSGDTGTGKSSCAEALVNDLRIDRAANFFHLKSGEMDGPAALEVISSLRFVPWGKGDAWRLILIDEADLWTPKAKNLWLSALEALPPRTVVVFTSNHPEKFDQRTLDRFQHLRFVGSGDESIGAAQRLADTIWQAETHGTDGPDVTKLPNVVIDGKVSYRRVASAMQDLVRGGALPAATLRTVSPSPMPITPHIETARSWWDEMEPSDRLAALCKVEPSKIAMMMERRALASAVASLAPPEYDVKPLLRSAIVLAYRLRTR